MVKKAGQADSDLDEEIGRNCSGVDEEAGMAGSDMQGLAGCVHLYRHGSCSELPPTPLRSHHHQATVIVDASHSLLLSNAGLVNLTNHAREISALSESVASGLWEVDHDRAEACEKSSRVKVGPLQVSARE